MSPAFRFFDNDMKGRVPFDQFVMGMETLKVKLSSKD